MNETQTKEKWIDKVAKLLSLAADSRAPKGERDSAQAMAERLMKKYRIESWETQKKHVSEESHADGFDVELFGEDGDWEAFLATGIAWCFECRAIISKKWDGSEKAYFIGMKDDLDLATDFFDTLQMTIDSFMDERYPQRRGNVRRRMAFSRGMVDEIVNRLTELYYNVKKQASVDCRDLIVLKGQLVDQETAKRFPNCKSMKAKKISNVEDYFAGRKAGSEVDLASNRTRVAN